MLKARHLFIAGGGSLRWIVKKLLHVDGLISAQGGSVTNYWQGTGSGGSVLFEVTNMTGLFLACHFSQGHYPRRAKLRLCNASIINGFCFICYKSPFSPDE